MNNITAESIDKLTLVDRALVKYPKAKRIAVANFTSGYNSLTMEASMNLEMDAGLYKWNSQTVAAIRWVLNQKARGN